VSLDRTVALSPAAIPVAAASADQVSKGELNSAALVALAAAAVALEAAALAEVEALEALAAAAFTATSAGMET
jgi:hypothetical protein